MRNASTQFQIIIARTTALIVVLGLFVLAVARHVGISISIGPKMSGMKLLYLAGAAWLLKR